MKKLHLSEESSKAELARARVLLRTLLVNRHALEGFLENPDAFVSRSEYPPLSQFQKEQLLEFGPDGIDDPVVHRFLSNLADLTEVANHLDRTADWVKRYPLTLNDLIDKLTHLRNEVGGKMAVFYDEGDQWTPLCDLKLDVSDTVAVVLS